MEAPVFIKYNTQEERVAAFEKWIHLREQWEENIKKREVELGIS